MTKRILFLALVFLSGIGAHAQYRLNVDSIFNEGIRIITHDTFSRNPEFAEPGEVILMDGTLPPFFKFDSKEKHAGLLRATHILKNKSFEEMVENASICLEFCISSDEEFLTFEINKFLLKQNFKKRDGIQIIYKLNEEKNIWEYDGVSRLYISLEDDFSRGNNIDMTPQHYSYNFFHISDCLCNIYYKYVCYSEIAFCKELSANYDLYENVVIDNISMDFSRIKFFEKQSNGTFIWHTSVEEYISAKLKQSDKDVLYWITWDDMDIAGSALTIKLSLNSCSFGYDDKLHITNLGYRKFRYIINNDDDCILFVF